MSDQLGWTRDAEGIEHPDDTALLAFVREELSREKAQEVYRHFSECARCQEYCRVGRLLYRMQPAYEVEASIAKQVFTYINNPASAWLARQRKRLRQIPGDIELGLALVRYWIVRLARAFPLVFKGKATRTTRRPSNRSAKNVSLVWVFALLLIAIVAALLLAPPLLGTLALLPKPTPPSTPTFAPQPTDTPTPIPTPVPTRAPIPSVSAATIHLCGTIANRFQERVGVCGSHFHPGDKLELLVYVAGSQPRPYHVLTANTQGQFQTFLVITQCRETISAMYVQDLTNRAVRSATLTNIQVGRCVVSPGG